MNDTESSCTNYEQNEVNFSSCQRRSKVHRARLRFRQGSSHQPLRPNEIQPGWAVWPQAACWTTLNTLQQRRLRSASLSEESSSRRHTVPSVSSWDLPRGLTALAPATVSQGSSGKWELISNKLKQKSPFVVMESLRGAVDQTDFANLLDLIRRKLKSNAEQDEECAEFSKCFNLDQRLKLNSFDSKSLRILVNWRNIVFALLSAYKKHFVSFSFHSLSRRWFLKVPTTRQQKCNQTWTEVQLRGTTIQTWRTRSLYTPHPEIGNCTYRIHSKFVRGATCAAAFICFHAIINYENSTLIRWRSSCGTVESEHLDRTNWFSSTSTSFITPELSETDGQG